MNRTFYLSIISGLIFLSACNRNTAKDANVEREVTIEQPKVMDANLITPEDPFKNQPNEFCTVIRKLDISYYAPNQEVEDISQYPKKYCLLDVCLDGMSSNGNVINLGGEDEIVTSSYELIKVFDSYEEAKAYVEKYKIVDFEYQE